MLGFDFKSHTVTLYDQGKHLITGTIRSTIGLAVVSILKKSSIPPINTSTLIATDSHSTPSFPRSKNSAEARNGLFRILASPNSDEPASKRSARAIGMVSLA